MRCYAAINPPILLGRKNYGLAHVVNLLGVNVQAEDTAASTS